MKRLHVHVAVDDLARSVRFYSAIFGVAPSVSKPDYAKWLLDDPRVNFAISARGGEAGLDHLGIQVETQDELREVYARLRDADRPVLEEGETTCCYARSEKAWIADPQGVLWETFLTTGDSAIHGDSAELEGIREASGRRGGETLACCGSAPTKTESACCSGAGASK